MMQEVKQQLKSPRLNAWERVVLLAGSACSITLVVIYAVSGQL